eukprot:TRINITY_DN8470_c0_g1_i1.p1 TRINITY_DN8470_c0_g1~~TRINITY_DN8470_c0_g1_i1.p1  ORF type:complete len:292 (-),score=75.28 TRINITY_DN8470_c0_g1_i1:43-837(-)
MAIPALSTCFTTPTTEISETLQTRFTTTNPESDTFLPNLPTRFTSTTPDAHKSSPKLPTRFSTTPATPEADGNIAQLPTRFTTSIPEANKTIQTPLNTNLEAPETFPNKRGSNEEEPSRKRMRQTFATNAILVSHPVSTFQQEEEDEIIRVVPVQPISKTYTKIKGSPKSKVINSPTSRNIKQNMTPAPKILNKFTLESDIKTEQTYEDLTERNKTMTPPRKESFMTPLRNSSAWRCTLCKKISSNKKVAIVHFKVAHPEKDFN